MAVKSNLTSVGAKSLENHSIVFPLLTSVNDSGHTSSNILFHIHLDISLHLFFMFRGPTEP